MPKKLITFLAIAAAFVTITPEARPQTDPRGQNAQFRCRPLPSGWQRQGCEFGELAVVNLLEIRRNRLIWNGQPLSDRAAFKYLAESTLLEPRPGVAFVVDTASSDSRVADIRGAIGRVYGCDAERPCVEYTVSEWKKARPPKHRDDSYVGESGTTGFRPKLVKAAHQVIGCPRARKKWKVVKN